MTRTLLQQALGALHPQANRAFVEATKDALRSALAAPQPEPVAYQRLVEGEWQQCSLFVAKGFSNKLDADCRELFAAPPAAPAPAVHPDEFTCPYCFDQGAAPAVPDDIAAIIACLGDDAALLRETTDDSEEIAQNMDDAAAALERLSAAPAVPDLKHKPTVQRLMDLARKFRATPGDLYDGAYKELQQACYEALSAAPAVREPIIDEMDAVASRYAHKLALDLECVLSDYNGKWWDTAMQTIGEYRMAMNRIHERESPTHMGEPVLPKHGIGGGGNG